MTLATFLIIADILAAIAGADWAWVQICEVVKKDGGLEAVCQNLLEVVRGQATPPTLAQLQQSNPNLHAQAVLLLGAQGGAA
jgi:hypothetical protein